MATLRKRIFQNISEANTGALPTNRYTIQHSHALYENNTNNKQVTHAARYEMVTEKVLIKPGLKMVDIVDEQTHTPTKPRLVKPARTLWKKGHGSLERVDEETGDIMHLAYEPAVYETPKIKTNPKRKQTRAVKIPPQYQLIRMRRPIPVKEKIRSPLIPRKTQQKQNTTQEVSAYREYKVICRLQKALKNTGQYTHKIDGIFGRATNMALSASQRLANLPTGKLDRKTLQHLGI
jgi:hypothetical protein